MLPHSNWFLMKIISSSSGSVTQQWLLWETPGSCHFPPIHWKAPSAGFVSLQTRLDVYTSHYPDGTSVKNIIHWAQVGPLTHTHPWDGPFTESQDRLRIARIGAQGVPDTGKVKARNQKRCWVQDELPWCLWDQGTLQCVSCAGPGRTRDSRGRPQMDVGPPRSPQSRTWGHHEAQGDVERTG